MSRVLVSSGVFEQGPGQTTQLATVRQVGPVYFDGRSIGEVAVDEYIVVDVKPGMHEIGCSPKEPVRNYIETRRVEFTPGETKSLVCNMASQTGDLAERYRTKTYVEPRAFNPAATPVEYTKIP